MSRLPSDTPLKWGLRIIAAIAGTIVLLIVLFLVIEAIPALQTVGLKRFFTDPSWHPAGGTEAGTFNLIPMLVGTILVTAGAILIAAPLGIASALFCQYYAPLRLGKLYRHLIELLAGIPSVVYGFWGLVVLAPLIRQWQPPGQSLLTAILILALMILPTVMLLSESTLRSVSHSYIQAANALGLSRWAIIQSVVLPTARGGIITAVLLGAGRAVGETMAVLMVAGNVVQMPDNLFAPVRTITANIALELGYAMDHHRSALFVTGLMLMAIIVMLVGFAHWINKGHVYD
ncbi:MAG: phosphate ABC transporter permease subunit PstC [Phycisphaeraceae bacterium]|nr:phosphate ABC transporter permease subunit PstC [Phycisphaeraceae bacterium]